MEGLGKLAGSSVRRLCNIQPYPLTSLISQPLANRPEEGQSFYNPDSSLFSVAGCLRPGPHGPALPLPFLLFPVVYLTPSPGLVTTGGPWANLRFVLSRNLPHSLFLPGSDALTFVPRIEPQDGEHSEKCASPLPELLIPCDNRNSLECQPHCSEALQSITLKQDKAELCHPFPPSTAQDLGPQEKKSIFLYWVGVEKKAAPILGPTQWQLLVP